MTNVNGTYTEFVYGPDGQKLALMNGQTLKSARVPLPGGGVAVYDPTGLIRYWHADWEGSIRFESTPTQTYYAGAAASAYGESYAGNPSGATALFAGLPGDTSSELEDATFRRYNPLEGRWISPDPVGLAAVDPTNPQSLNRYAYVMNSPTTLTDPSGLKHCFGPEWPCLSAALLNWNSDGGPWAGGATFQVWETSVPWSFNDREPGEIALFSGFLAGTNWLYNYGGSPFGGGGGFDTPAQLAPPPSRLDCGGKAYVLAGNPANIGQTGFPGVTVTNGSAAIIPRQFTGQFTAGPLMRSIGASTFGTVTGPNGATESFNTLTQTVGNAALGTALQAQNIIMARDPGALVVEIVGGTNTWKNASVNLNMPALGEGCPAGTSVVGQ